MTDAWVKAVWEASLKENVRATSSKFDRYRCPPFLNMFITSTNVPKDERTELKKLIHSNGGVSFHRHLPTLRRSILNYLIIVFADIHGVSGR